MKMNRVDVNSGGVVTIRLMLSSETWIEKDVKVQLSASMANEQEGEDGDCTLWVSGGVVKSNEAIPATLQSLCTDTGHMVFIGDLPGDVLSRALSGSDGMLAFLKEAARSGWDTVSVSKELVDLVPTVDSTKESAE